MTRHDPRVSLAQMRDHAVEAIELAAGCSREELKTNRLLVLGLTKLVEIIGEAASRVPASVRSDYPGIQWRNVIGTRNRLVHGYDKVDLDILWQILRDDLPKLVAALQNEA